MNVTIKFCATDINKIACNILAVQPSKGHVYRAIEVLTYFTENMFHVKEEDFEGFKEAVNDMCPCIDTTDWTPDKMVSTMHVLDFADIFCIGDEGRIDLGTNRDMPEYQALKAWADENHVLDPYFKLDDFSFVEYIKLVRKFRSNMFGDALYILA